MPDPSQAIPDRPLFHRSVQQLRHLVAVADGDDAVLDLISAELASREDDEAIRLLAELQALDDPTESPPSAAVDAAPGAGGSGSDWQYDSQQRAIIEAPASVRVIVDAPPGTGKTAVACGRIAWLLRSGVAGSRIWLVSFTRTAIRELRNRVGDLATSYSDMIAVRVSTLDSRAWELVQGFRGTASGDYERTITQAIDLIRSGNDGMRELLAEMLHLVVDEAQDLVGDRATLIQEIIQRVPPECGVTILTDDAQSIYGFSDDDAPSGEASTTLPQRLRGDQREFRECSLTRVYRTANPRLRHLFIEVRADLLDTVETDPGFTYGWVRSEAEASSDGPTVDVVTGTASDSALLLFRTRAEVLAASAWLASRPEPQAHRIRTSGLPVCIHPWVAALLGRTALPRLTRTEFDETWPRLDRLAPGIRPSPAAAWSLLARAAGRRGAIDLMRLRDVLSRPRPPLEFCLPEIGFHGPILSTIHASKGREADEVHLYLPQGVVEGSDAAEESRIVFVGATRARQSLRVGQARPAWGRNLEGTGRAHARGAARATNQHWARIEIGREGDIDDLAPIATCFMSSDDDAEWLQRWLTEMADASVRLKATRQRLGGRFSYVLHPEVGGQTLGALLDESVGRDLFRVAHALWPDESLRPPTWIGPIFMFGSRSVVLGPDEHYGGALREPYSSSGFWLAPVVIGFPSVPFWRYTVRAS